MSRCSGIPRCHVCRIDAYSYTAYTLDNDNHYIVCTDCGSMGPNWPYVEYPGDTESYYTVWHSMAIPHKIYPDDLAFKLAAWTRMKL